MLEAILEAVRVEINRRSGTEWVRKQWTAQQWTMESTVLTRQALFDAQLALEEATPENRRERKQKLCLLLVELMADCALSIAVTTGTVPSFAEFVEWLRVE